MPDTFTPNLNLDQPAVGADSDTWGTLLNNDLAAIDAVFNPDASGTSVGINVGTGKVAKIAGTLKSIAGAVVQFVASTVQLIDDTDATKVLKFLLSGITTGTTRTLTVPDASGTLVLNDNTATLTGKTYDTAGAGNVLKINGTQVSAVTGSGAVVLAGSPALTGVPTAPTPASSDNTTTIATTAFVQALVAGLLPTTGDMKITLKTTADVGWVKVDDGTIGSATSGATTRANADCQALFTLLWTNMSNALCPVSGGRGASAAADWAANKTIGLTKMLGRALVVAGAGAGLTARTLGDTVGVETGTYQTTGAFNWTGQYWSGAGSFDGTQAGDHIHGVTVSQMQPSAFVNVFLKL